MSPDESVLTLVRRRLADDVPMAIETVHVHRRLVPETFGVESGRVIALLAGGGGTAGTAVEGAEDDTDAARQDVAAAEIGAGDAVVGVAASGRTWAPRTRPRCRPSWWPSRWRPRRRQPSSLSHSVFPC